MGNFLFWALVFFLAFGAVSAIGGIAQAIALKRAPRDLRDVAEEERARTVARVLAESEAKQALAAKAAKEINDVLHPPYGQNWQRRNKLADLRLRNPEAAAEAEGRLVEIEEEERVRAELRKAEYKRQRLARKVEKQRQRLARKAEAERQRLERNARRRAVYAKEKLLSAQKLCE